MVFSKYFTIVSIPIGFLNIFYYCIYSDWFSQYILLLSVYTDWVSQYMFLLYLYRLGFSIYFTVDTTVKYIPIGFLNIFILYGGNQIKAEWFASSLFLWNRNAAMKKTTTIPLYIGYHRSYTDWFSYIKSNQIRSYLFLLKFIDT